MIKYTGEKKYEKAVIAAVEDWLRYHLPAGSTGVKLYEVELLDLDGCDIKAKVNYDINYSGIYEDEFENVTDEISFETDRAICDTFRESLQAEDEDGWGEQIEEELAQSLDFAADIAYEVRNCVRGSYVVDGDKVEDLVKSLRSLVDELEIAIENIESDAKSINESKSIKEDYVSEMSKEAEKVQDYLHSIGFTSALVRLGHGTTELEVTGYYDPYKMLAILEKLANIGYKSDDVDGDFRETSYGLVADVTKVKVNESKSIKESIKVSRDEMIDALWYAPYRSKLYSDVDTTFIPTLCKYLNCTADELSFDNFNAFSDAMSNLSDSELMNCYNDYVSHVLSYLDMNNITILTDDDITLLDGIGVSVGSYNFYDAEDAINTIDNVYFNNQDNKNYRIALNKIIRDCGANGYPVDGEFYEETNWDYERALKLIDVLNYINNKQVNESKSIKESPDMYGLPTDDELESEYRNKLDKAKSERDLMHGAHEQELFDSSFLEELEDWLKKFTDMNKDAEYADIVKNNPDLFNCNDFELGILIDTHKKAITWLTYAIKALKGNKYYYHKWASAPFVYYTGGYGSPVGLVRRNVKAIFKEIPSYFSHLVDLVNGFHRVAYASGGGSNGGYSKVLTALISDERVDYKLSTFEKFKDWLDNNGIFIKQRYNFKYNQASWNEFIVTGINNSDIQLNRLKSFDSICAKFDSEFSGWTLHFSRISTGSDRGKVRGSFSRGDRQYTNYTDTDYENDIVVDDTVEPAAIKSNADVNDANIVTIVKDSGKLRAQADDGEHGTAFVAFPNSLRNAEGQKYKVDRLIWNGKNYRTSGNIEPISESIKESTKKSYVFSKNESKYSLNSK